jgi:hypothetical protein
MLLCRRGSRMLSAPEMLPIHTVPGIYTRKESGSTPWFAFVRPHTDSTRVAGNWSAAIPGGIWWRPQSAAFRIPKFSGEIVSLTFNRPEIALTFQSALLGGLLIVLQNTLRNVPLLICSSSGFFAQTLVLERHKSENNLLDPETMRSEYAFILIPTSNSLVKFNDSRDILLAFKLSELWS